MKKFIAGFLVASLLSLCLIQPVLGLFNKDQSPYIAVIATRNRLWMWNLQKYAPNYLAAPKDWDELPDELKEIASKSEGRQIVLDLHVHGGEGGLYLEDDKGYTDRASMGYLLVNIQKYLGNRRVLILLESCFAGRAYKNTIRDNVMYSPYDNIADYKTIPNFPVYGSGDNFASIGQVMYMQWRHNFHRWWVDLREYDPKGSDRQVGELEKTDKYGFSETTTEMLKIVDFFREQIP